MDDDMQRLMENDNKRVQSAIQDARDGGLSSPSFPGMVVAGMLSLGAILGIVWFGLLFVTGDLISGEAWMALLPFVLLFIGLGAGLYWLHTRVTV